MLRRSFCCEAHGLYPKSVIQRYWDERQRCKLVTGWSAEGMLALEIFLQVVLHKELDDSCDGLCNTWWRNWMISPEGLFISLKVFLLILPCFLIVYPGLCRSSNLATFAALASLLFSTTGQGILTSSNESFLFRRQPIIAYNIHRLYMQGHTCSGFVRFLQLQRNCCKARNSCKSRICWKDRTYWKTAAECLHWRPKIGYRCHRE